MCAGPRRPEDPLLTIDSIPIMAAIDRLPAELFASTASNEFLGTFDYLDENELVLTRSTNRRFRDLISPIFRRTFFTTLSVSLDAQGLDKLAAIAHHAAISPYVQTLRFCFKNVADEQSTSDLINCGHLPATLAASLKVLKNCEGFICAFHPAREEEISAWQRVLKIDTDDAVDHPEQIVKRLATYTIEAAHCARMRLTSICTDGEHAVIGLERSFFWDMPAQMLRHYPDFRLDLDVLDCSISCDDHVERVDLAKFFEPCMRVPKHVEIYLDEPKTAEGRINASLEIHNLMQQKGYRYLTIHAEHMIDSFHSIGALESLARANRDLLSFNMRGLHFHTTHSQISELIAVVKKLTSGNPEMSKIDLGCHHFSVYDALTGSSADFGLSMSDERPDVYGASLMAEKLARLGRWANAMLA